MLSICDRGPAQPAPSPFNMAAHVLRHADAQPDKIALAVLSLSGAERWSYGKLQAAVLGTATGLLEAGLKPGDKLLVRLGNTVEFPIAYLAAIAVDLVPVPTSSQLTEPEVVRMIDTLDPAGILHDPGVACPDTPGRIRLEAENLHDMWGLPPATPVMGDPNRLAYVVYTSGTSGVQRAVGHAHRAIWARRMMTEGWYGLRADDRVLHAGAFNWTFTLGTGLMDPWAAGATALIPAAGVDMAALPLLLKRHDATIFAAAPGVYRKFLSQGAQLSLPRLRHGLVAGEKLSASIHAAWNAATGTSLFEAYGMSECSTFISSCPDDPTGPEFLGRPQQGRKVAILDDDGPVPLGDPGTIAVSQDDPGLMLGYLGAEDDTAARFRDGWFLTGDIGAMDAAGHITYHGRDDDMMNAGGYRVSPLEVEAALHDFPGLADIGVIDVEIKEGVRVIAAFYEAADHIDTDKLDAFAAGRLARYKQPRLYRRVDTLPRGANGKLTRRALRETFEAHDDQA